MAKGLHRPIYSSLSCLMCHSAKHLDDPPLHQGILHCSSPLNSELISVNLHVQTVCVGMCFTVCEASVCIHKYIRFPSGS